MSETTDAVFISYASQDVDAARRLGAGLQAAGIEVWLDQSELRGGDAWDQKIRREIKSCALFVPLISAHTRARTEGYFRLEWKLAVDRSHLMAADRAFLLPVAIDPSAATDSSVPERFREIQWTSLPGGEPTQAFIERVARLLAAGGDAGIKPPIDAMSRAAPAPTPRPAAGARPLVYGLAAAAVLLLGSAAWIWRQHAAEARVIPYSAEDRRMTFALLPLQPAADDPAGAPMAKASSDALFKSLDENHEWVNLASPASVAQALAKFASLHDLAKSLNVHFLFRGNVDRSSAGRGITLLVVDGDTEHVLGSKNLTIPTGALAPDAQQIDHVTGELVFYALEDEVTRARQKPDAALDVRDLSFRAFVDWGHKRMADDGKGAYGDASELLHRALVLAPDDALALRLTAEINLCDCVNAWSTNIAEQQAIGEAAIDRFLSRHPNDTGMLHQKAILYQLRGRFEESLLLLDSILKSNPENSSALEDKAIALLKLGRAREAAAPASAALEADPGDHPWRAALLAAIDYELKDYANAELLAQSAITKMTKAQLSSSNTGTVRLTMIAAAAYLHDETARKAALADLAVSVPQLTSLSAIRRWMSPEAYLSGYEPLFEGLRLAGVQE